MSHVYTFDRVLRIKRLTLKRLELGISRAEAARLSHLSVSTLRDWENYYHLPDHKRLLRYQDFLTRCEQGRVNFRKTLNSCHVIYREIYNILRGDEQCQPRKHGGRQKKASQLTR